MVRSRVMSFMSAFKPQMDREHRSDVPASSSRTNIAAAHTEKAPDSPSLPVQRESPSDRQRSSTAGRERSNSRPASMIGGYIPPVMDLAQDTIPELLPIFTLLNSHSNKLYQEGYFLKLNDLDVQGKPYPDRTWGEYFAQLVGTVLSLWDAAELDVAGEEGQVTPIFINLADASIKMINTLQTRASEGQPLQNVLSISTAGKNRYLLHFSSYNALTQWTAAIRLAMFENACLQEAYTGSLIAGKGKDLNNIRQIMTKTVFKTEEWTRVRFGAGTPWRRCWCVVSPPDEKEIKNQAKQAKKSSAYSRSAPVVKGDIKFYDTRKVTKKTKPVATINDAFSSYAVYPQSRALIDQSTLIKIEGLITIHAQPEVTTEGFVFVMPEVHPAVSGFEMMLRFLFPIYDVFHLYGRPNRLIADTLDTRGLMFALPQEKRYGYLEIFDVGSLIGGEGNAGLSEREWRKRMKNLVSERVSRNRENGGASRTGSRSRHRNSLPGHGGSLRFADADSMGSTPSLHRDAVLAPPVRTDSAPPGDGLVFSKNKHSRSVSDSLPPSPHRRAVDRPSRLSHEQRRPSFEERPTPPPHGVPQMTAPYPGQHHGELDEGDHRSSSEDDGQVYRDAHEPSHPLPSEFQPGPGPVAPPPAFAHQSTGRATGQPRAAPELRRANSRMSSATLSQLAQASNPHANRMDEGLVGDGREGMILGDDPYAQQGHGPANSYVLESPSFRQGGRHFSPSTSASSSNTSLSQISHSESLRPDHTVERRPSPLGQSPLLGTASSTPETTALLPNPPPQTEAPPAGAVPPPPPGPTRTVSSIARKPLPQQSSAHDLTSSPSVVNRSIRRKAVDSAVANIRPADTIEPESDSDPRSAGGYSSNYSDSPATLRSPQLPIRNDQVRTGVLKTIGGQAGDVTVGDARYAHQSAMRSPTFDLPEIDFGRTPVYAPDQPGQAQQRPTHQTARGDPVQEGHLGLRRSQERLQLDLQRPGSAPSAESNRRSMPWQPSTPPHSPNAQPSLTPEQYVQQRATTAGRMATAYAHNRQGSMTPPKDTRKRLSKTPPGRMQHQTSGDWSAQRQGQPTSRPSSRGPSVALAPKQDYSHRLSAREQEHVARVTNTPLINLASSQKGPQRESSGGLVAAVAAREQEKQAFKAGHGYGGHMVQQAIAQRASQQYQERRPSPGNYGAAWDSQSVGQPSVLPYAPLPQQQQQQQQQGYFQDTYGNESAYRSHSPAFGQQAVIPNRYSYQPQQQEQQQHPLQTTPQDSSPGFRGHRPGDSHDSFFGRQGR